MFCTSCGEQLDDGSKFCTACGNPIDVDDQIEDVEVDAKVEAPEPEESSDDATAQIESDSMQIEVDDESTVLSDTNATEFSTANAVEVISNDSGVEDHLEGQDQSEESDAPTKEFDLPDSALEPSTPAVDSGADESSDQPALTQAMPYIAETNADESKINPVIPASESNSSPVPKKKKSNRNRIIAACSAAAVVVAAAVGAILVIDPFNPNQSINSDAFPNDIIRSAILDQLDEDGDGRLSDEEADKVTALVFTPIGAQFVTDGEQVNVQEIRNSIDQKKQKPNDGQGSDNKQSAGQGPNDSTDNPQGQSNDMGAELGVFKNMETLIATDSDLKEIDLSSMTDLEYVDLRNNPDLHSFDLAKNSKIKVLFCDEDTEITGLDEAGLYFTDLVSSFELNANLFKTSYAVDYDTRARLISVTEKASSSTSTTTYEYDEQGRLIKEEAESGSMYNLYSYGKNGLLSSAVGSCNIGDYAPPYAYAYGYDNKGYVTERAEGTTQDRSLDAVTYKEAGVFSYTSGKLNSYKSTDSSILFTMNDANSLLSAVKNNGDFQDEFECTHLEDGTLSFYSIDRVYMTGSDYRSSYSTAYSAEAIPTKTESLESSSSDVTNYLCNADGYLSRIIWDDDNDYTYGGTGEIKYIKRVGSLADRPSERFVPLIRPSVDVDPVFGFSPWSGLQNWLISSGSKTAVTMFVLNPFDVTNTHIGVPTYTLSCPNEEKLAAYDREHWTDGLTISGDQPIEAAGVNDLLAQAAAAALPVPVQTFIDDPVYGGVVKEYLDAAKNATSSYSGYSYASQLQSKYPDIPDNVIQEMGRNAYGSNSDLRTIEFAFVDLNGDGSNELAVSFPVFFRSNGTSDREAELIALYGNTGGTPKLITSGDDHHSCWVASNGDIVLSDEASFSYGYFTIKRWDGSSSKTVGGVEWQGIVGGDFDYTLYSSDGSESSLTISYDKFFSEVLDKYRDQYPPAKLNWTPIAVG